MLQKLEPPEPPPQLLPGGFGGELVGPSAGFDGLGVLELELLLPGAVGEAAGRGGGIAGRGGGAAGRGAIEELDGVLIAVWPEALDLRAAVLRPAVLRAVLRPDFALRAVPRADDLRPLRLAAPRLLFFARLLPRDAAERRTPLRPPFLRPRPDFDFDPVRAITPPVPDGKFVASIIACCDAC